MKKRLLLTVFALSGVIAFAVANCASGADGAVAFKEARLITEINATDGDAGLQVFLDHEPWKSVSIARPDGEKILDVVTRTALEGYGLTELFSESSEPPFTEFPLAEFKKLFPEGNYTFSGVTIDGKTLRSTVPFSHDFPAGPKIRSPQDDSTIAPRDLVVRWSPGNQPSGVTLKGFQVLVVRETAPLRTFSADLPASARSIEIPDQFLQGGVEEYKAEVLAIDDSGNQTLSEVTFSTK